MLDDSFETNLGVKDLPRQGIEPQPPSPLSDAITIRPWLLSGGTYLAWSIDFSMQVENLYYSLETKCGN